MIPEIVDGLVPAGPEGAVCGTDIALPSVRGMTSQEDLRLVVIDLDVSAFASGVGWSECEHCRGRH